MYSKYCSDFSQTRETSNADVTHLAFTASRLVSSAGHTTGRSRITRKPIVSRYFETHGGVIYTRYKMLDGELINIGRAYEHADSTFHLCLIAHGEPPAHCLRPRRKTERSSARPIRFATAPGPRQPFDNRADYAVCIPIRSNANIRMRARNIYGYLGSSPDRLQRNLPLGKEPSNCTCSVLFLLCIYSNGH